jgi:hypothetical protein
MNREHAQLRATEIKANNAAARHAVEQAKAAETLPVVAEQPVDAAVVEANAAVKAARETLDHLRGRKLVSEAKGADLTAERSQISFAALGSQDSSAQRRLAEIHNEIATHASEMASIDAAVNEAKQRLEMAESAAARSVEQQKARGTLALLDDLHSAAAGCDAALRDFLRSFDQLERVSAAICRITGTPSHEIVAALGRRAVHTAMFPKKAIFDLPHPGGPAARVTFGGIAAAWSRATRHWCLRRLGGSAPKDKEAA